MVHRLKITDVGHHLLSRMISIFIPIKTPACELYLAYYATSSAAGSRVNSASKTFEDDLKISPNSNCMGVSAEFSKFARGRSKTVMMRFDDVIIKVIM